MRKSEIVALGSAFAGMNGDHMQAEIALAANSHRTRAGPEGRYSPQARKASSKTRWPGVPFSTAKMARLPLV